MLGKAGNGTWMDEEVGEDPGEMTRVAACSGKEAKKGDSARMLPTKED